MAQIADTSPYVYMATAFFAFSSLWSDLMCIRCSLSFGFLGLVLAGLSGYDKNGSFQNIPLSEGIVDITLIINMVLFCLNSYIFGRLIWDEVRQGTKMENQDELALFRFFHSRSGITALEFKHILKHGQFVELEAGEKVPKCHRTLYLVIEGKVVCNCLFNGVQRTHNFIKRSGEFFDTKMFNLFTLPIGFDNTDFQAVTKRKTLLFAWDVTGLIEMRELKSPSLVRFWEYTVLRSLCATAVRHHLKQQETLYDSLLIPEDQEWLDGARSRDFGARGPDKTRCDRVCDQLRIFSRSIHPIPPQGIRHFPHHAEPNPKQHELEALCKGELTRSVFDRDADKADELETSRGSRRSWADEA